MRRVDCSGNRFVATFLSLLMLIGVAMPALAQESDGYKRLYGAEMTSLNYLSIGTANEYRVMANYMDTLVEYDRYGQVQPSLATSWDVSEDGRVWTFHLREGVKWVDHTGAEVADVVAHDFVTAAKYLLNAQNAAATADVLYNVVEGAEAYYMGTATPEEGEEPAPVTEWDTVGVRALDDYTLEYTLVAPTPYFLSMTTYVSFMPVNEAFMVEKGESFGLPTGPDTVLYCGAYYLSEFSPQEKRVLTKNELNWDADNVFIPQITHLYNKEVSTVEPEMYLRGESHEADISSEVATEWLADPQKADMIRPLRQEGYFSYFYAFNFDPQFDAVYEPDNWRLAVMNENFRKSISFGLDRLKAMLVTDPENPEMLIYNTITPPEFVDIQGEDYVNMGALADITALGMDTFNEEMALEYRDKAMEELTAQGVTFPIKILTSYNPNVVNWDEECQVVEQQLEALLGSDYIDIIVEAGPSTGFLSEVRRSGKYALLKCNWGPDYADPQTFTDPFRKENNNYNFLPLMTQVDENGKPLPDTYYELIEAAQQITDPLTERYEAFAAAEAFLINHTIIIPFGFGTGGYQAKRLNPFTNQFAPFGISQYRYKGQQLLDHPMNTDEFFDAYDKWLEERAALAQAE